MLASLGGDFEAENSLEDGESLDAEAKDGLLSTLLKEGASVNARTDSSGNISSFPGFIFYYCKYCENKFFSVKVLYLTFLFLLNLKAECS